MQFKINILAGGNPPRFVPFVAERFMRKSAALAYMIDYATEANAKIIYEDDEENPGTMDILVCKGEYADQFEIVPEGEK